MVLILDKLALNLCFGLSLLLLSEWRVVILLVRDLVFLFGVAELIVTDFKSLSGGLSCKAVI